jgi:hypothetical protein
LPSRPAVVIHAAADAGRCPVNRPCDGYDLYVAEAADICEKKQK